MKKAIIVLATLATLLALVLLVPGCMNVPTVAEAP
jgi:hypothetical protein